tara:strand:- start:210 stop:509 length:300 start_codon:yes stop_codon:yes gene_type:complete
VKRLSVLLAGAAMLLSSGALQAHVSAKCTDAPREQWLHILDMQKKIVNEHGFAIKKFQVAGTCYEIYGWGLSKDGKKFEEIEAYFDPVTGALVKKKIRD